MLLSWWARAFRVWKPKQHQNLIFNVWPSHFLSYLLNKTEHRLQIRAKVLWHSPQFLLLTPLAPVSLAQMWTMDQAGSSVSTRSNAYLWARCLKNTSLSQIKSQICTTVNQDYPIQQAFSTVINCSCNHNNSKSLFSVWLLRKMWEIFLTIFEPSQDCDLRKKVFLLNKPSTVYSARKRT